MNVKIMNSYLVKIYQGKSVLKKTQYSSDVIAKFKKTVGMLQFADDIPDLKRLKGLNFEGLKMGKFKGYYSVRVDQKYRLILSIQKNATESVGVILAIHELTNHYQ